MGYRCTLSSNYNPAHELPVWFKEKYEDHLLFGHGLTIGSKRERKFYDNEFFEDYQKSIEESGYWDGYRSKVYLTVLGEDGAVFKVIIEQNKIEYNLMHEWLETDGILTYTGSN
jgi:hypothetical protein